MFFYYLEFIFYINLTLFFFRELHQIETLWFKDDIPIEDCGVRFSFNGLWNRTLVLQHIEPHYNGQYKCQVRLKTTIDTPKTALANVTVQGMYI